MNVRFKKNTEPCIVYRVLNAIPIIEYDEYFKKYCECIEIEVMGLVPLELLTEATEHKDNLKAIDFAVYLTNDQTINNGR